MTWFVFDRVGLRLDDLAGLDMAAWTPRPVPLLAASTLLLGAYFVSAAIWGRMVVDLGGPRIPSAVAVRLFMIANLGRYLPGKVWQIAGLAALAKQRGVPAATATGAAVMGQGVALVAATLVGLVSLLAGSEQQREIGLVTAAVVAVALGLIALPAVFRRTTGIWFRLARSEPPPSLGRGDALRWLLLYTGNWIMYAVSFWMLAHSLDASAPLVPVASAFAAAYVLGYVAIFAPAGGGVREVALVALLAPYLGVAPSTAIALVARIWTTLVEVVPAGIFWIRHVLSRQGTLRPPPAAGPEPRDD